jgi:chitinase
MNPEVLCQKKRAIYWLVGALGGQFNDDPASLFRYEQRNTITGENDDLLFQGTQSTNGINLYGFGSKGHMIPVIKAVGDKIDLIAYQGHNTGGSNNRGIMYDAYA